MPLRAPQDNTVIVKYLCIAACLCSIVFLLTRDNLPHIGDQTHSFKHGGFYQDGTKRAVYCGPRKNNPSSNLFSGFGSTFWIVFGFTLCLIYATRRSISSRRVTCTCFHFLCCDCQPATTT
nr:TGB2 protein [Wheat virus Q]